LDSLIGFQIYWKLNLFEVKISRSKFGYFLRYWSHFKLFLTLNCLIICLRTCQINNYWNIGIWNSFWLKYEHGKFGCKLFVSCCQFINVIHKSMYQVVHRDIIVLILTILDCFSCGRIVTFFVFWRQQFQSCFFTILLQSLRGLSITQVYERIQLSILCFVIYNGERACFSVGAFSIDVLLVFCDLNFELYELDTFYNKVVPLLFDSHWFTWFKNSWTLHDNFSIIT
jgi:hypothetical protein